MVFIDGVKHTPAPEAAGRGGAAAAETPQDLRR